MKDRIAKAVEQFAGANGKDELRACLEQDPAEFERCARELLADADGRPGYRYLVYLLLTSGLLARALFEPDGLTRDQAITLAASAARTDALTSGDFDGLVKASLAASDSRSSGRLLRMLDVLSASSWTESLKLHRDELLAHRDSSVRSKAALVIARVTKDPAWVMRLLLNADPRVQANAVEGLWRLRQEGCKEVFLQAAQSPNARVAANGVVGLYRLGEVESIAALLRLLGSRASVRRRAALWLIGETEDLRFIDYLRDRHKTASPSERYWILRALARIRRRCERAVRAGEIEISARSIRPAADAPSEAEYRLAISLFSVHEPELDGVPPLQFGLSQGRDVVAGYIVSSRNNPAALVVGFVLPHVPSASDPYLSGIDAALNECLAAKRPADAWRIDRYLLNRPADASKAAQNGGGTKQYRGFLTDPGQIREVIAAAGASNGAKDDLQPALERMLDSSAYIAGERHVFVFFDAGSAAAMSASAIDKVIETAQAQRAVIHGFLPGAAGASDGVDPIARACAAGLQIVSAENIAAAVRDSYRGLLNSYEIRFSPPDGASGPIGLQVWSEAGFGEIRFTPESLLERAA
jgi:HEAT repeats